MMPQEFISSSAAAHLAKISEGTLRRFAEAGYLHSRNGPAGEELFSQVEVAKLFGLSLPARVEATNAPPAPVTLSWDEEDEDLSEEASEIMTASSTPATQRPLSNTEAQEMMRLKTLSELQERLIEVQASQITQLQSERDWLRERVERLETKSDRDQGLILSKTQTIERLVFAMSQRRSPFIALLEWFGFQPPQQQSARALGHEGTIEMQQ